MKLAIISDLHIGSGDETDRFGHDDYEFLRFLKFLEGDFEKIILLGDIFETLTGRKYGMQMDELKRCFQAHPEVSERLVGHRQKYIYIHGNHDLVSAEAFSSRGEHFMSTGGVNMFFTHGHIFDRFSFNARRLTEWMVWIGGHLLRRGSGSVYDMFRKLDDIILKLPRDFKKRDFNFRALYAAKAMGIDMIVTGHSHAGGCAEEDRAISLNSGACHEGKFQYVSMDTRTMDYAYNSAW